MPPAADVWAQCENAHCQKWRKLPPGTVVDENQPWYCYMNPDPERNRCEAPEVEYEQSEEVLVGDVTTSEDGATPAPTRGGPGEASDTGGGGGSEESSDGASSEGDGTEPGLAVPSQPLPRRIAARVAAKLLDGLGHWDPADPSVAPPLEAWRVLSAADPELASVAAAALDTASSDSGDGDGGEGGDGGTADPALVARLMLMIAAERASPGA